MTRTKTNNPILAVYSVKTPGQIFLTFVSIITFSAIILPFLSLLIYAFPDFKNHGLLFAFHKNYILAGLFFIAMVIMAILIVVNDDRTHKKVFIYKNGIFIHYKTACYLTWDQIAGISAKFVQHKVFNRNTTKSIKCDILTTNGKWIKIPSTLKYPTHFLTILKSQVYPLLQPNILEQLNTGKTVYFGIISIKKPGFIYKMKSFQIEQIKLTSIISGHLLIEFHNSSKVLKIPTHQLINSELLINALNS